MTFALVVAPLLLFASTPTTPSTASTAAVTPDAPPTAAPVPPPAPVVAPRTASNVVFAEALGNGLLYSLNYERIIEQWNIGLRAGISYFTYAVSDYGMSGNLKLATFPFVVSYYYGTPKHKLQLGLGATLLYTGVSSDSTGTKFESARSGAGLSVTGVVGYRYLPPAGGFSFGVGFTPLLRSGSFLPWGGAEAGYGF